MRKTMAVAIRTVDFKDNDKMITFLTQDFGLMSAKARGAKKQTGKLFCASSLFCCGEYTFFEKNGFFGVKGGHALHQFGHLREDYDAYATACFIADAAGKVAQEEYASPKLFALVVNALYALDTGAVSPGAAVCYFVQRLLLIEGLYPVLDHCTVCGTQSGLGYFSISHGGVVCSSCAGGEDEVRFGPAAKDALDSMQGIVPLEMGAVKLDADAEKMLKKLLVSLLEFALQTPLKTTKYLNGEGLPPLQKNTC